MAIPVPSPIKFAAHSTISSPSPSSSPYSPSSANPFFFFFSPPASVRLSRPLFLLGLLLVLVQYAQSDSSGVGLFPGQNEWEEHRICGRLLINALKTVCNHQYVQPTRDQLYDNYYKSTGMLFRARRGSSTTAAFIGGPTRRRRGIIFECCTNKCSLNYIRNNYCAVQGPTADGGPISSWQFVEEASKKRRR